MQRSLTEAEISARAYDIWEQAGRPEGQAESHWYQAIEELSTPERAMAVGSTEQTEQ